MANILFADRKPTSLACYCHPKKSTESTSSDQMFNHLLENGKANPQIYMELQREPNRTPTHKENNLNLFINLCVLGGIYRCQRTTSKSWFSFHCVVLGIQLRQSGLAASTFIHWAILQAPKQNHKKDSCQLHTPDVKTYYKSTRI